MHKAPSTKHAAKPHKPATIDMETGAIIPEAKSPPASAIAAINALHRKAQAVAGEARAKTEEAAHLAILVGLRLRALRPTVAHGGWEKLFTSAARRLNGETPNKKPSANAQHVAHFEFSEASARNYISAAEGVLEHRLTRKKALALQGLAGKDTLAEADKKLLNEASRGETLRQLYLDLKIIRPTQAESMERNRNTKGGPTKAALAAKREAAGIDQTHLRLKLFCEPIADFADAMKVHGSEHCLWLLPLRSPDASAGITSLVVLETFLAEQLDRVRDIRRKREKGQSIEV